MFTGNRARSISIKSNCGDVPPLTQLLESDFRLCGVLAVAKRIGAGEYEVTRLRCRRWGCPVCGPWRQRELSHDIEAAIHAHGLTHFLSLTTDHGDGERLMKSWRALVDRVGDAIGARPKFAWVLGRHESHGAHLHVVLNANLEPEKWATVWKSVGGGSSTKNNFHIKAIDDVSGIAEYLVEDVLVVTRRRRCGSSRGIKLSPRTSSGRGWGRLVAPFDVVRDSLGDCVSWVKRGRDGRVDSFGVKFASELEMDDKHQQRPSNDSLFMINA